MSAGAWRERLQAAGDVLLDEDAPLSGWWRAARDLHALLSEITGLTEAADLPGVDRDTRLPSGAALSPRAAARSVDDFVRTARFAQGLAVALREAERRFAPPIEVLYAGCGPFATLCLPLAGRAGPDRVRFTLLDVHAASLRLAERVLADCGLRPLVRALVEEDAAAYRHPGPLHVVLAETMGQALEREPQVAVVANLAPQLREGGRLVPDRVRVDACLADPAREFGAGDRPRLPLGTVLELTGRSAAAIAAGLPPVELAVPHLPAGSPTWLMLRTAVGVEGRLALADYDSGITYPRFLNELGPLRPGQAVRVAYGTGGEPRFRCSVV